MTRRTIPTGGGPVTLEPVPPTCAACGEYAPDHAVTCDERTLRPETTDPGARLRMIRAAAARHRPRHDTD